MRAVFQRVRDELRLNMRGKSQPMSDLYMFHIQRDRAGQSLRPPGLESATSKNDSKRSLCAGAHRMLSLGIFCATQAATKPELAFQWPIQQ